MPKMFKSSKPIKNCLLLEFNTQKDLALAFCRVEEYYEGVPQLNKKYTSFIDFIDFFMKDDGSINYFNYWSGFNIPGNAFMEWSQQNMSDKTYWELALINEVEKKLDLASPFYIIGGKKGEMNVIDHEIAHALYYMNESYKSEMEDLNYDFFKKHRMQYSKMVKALKKMGYGENVIKDEVQAYMSTSKKSELVIKFGLDYDTVLPMIRQYRKVLSWYNTRKK
jgi:ribosomal protein S9